MATRSTPRYSSMANWLSRNPVTSPDATYAGLRALVSKRWILLLWLRAESFIWSSVIVDQSCQGSVAR